MDNIVAFEEKRVFYPVSWLRGLNYKTQLVRYRVRLFVAAEFNTRIV